MIFQTIYSFVNIFAGGRSEVKALLFLLYLCLLTILYFLFRNNNFRNFKWIYFTIGILCLYIYGFILQISYTLINNFSLTDFVITGKNGEISSSVIYHTHIAKGILGQVFSFFGKTQLMTMDAGGAYIGFFPSYVFLFGAILLVAVLLQTIIYFVSNFKKFTEDKNNRQKFFLIIGYAIISFSLIKTAIDGGVFNQAFYLSIIFIILFVLQNKGKLNINFYYFLAFIGISLVALSIYIDSFMYGNGLVVAYVSVLLLLYTILLYGIEKKIRLQFFIPLVLLFSISFWVSGVRDRDIYNYSNIVLHEGERVFVYNKENREVEILNIKETGTIADVSKKVEKNITYMPVTVPGVTCMERAPFEKVSATLVLDKPLLSKISTTSKYIVINNGNSTLIGKNWHTDLNIFINNCIPEPLSVLDGELKKNNIYNYILLNPSFYDSSNY